MAQRFSFPLQKLPYVVRKVLLRLVDKIDLINLSNCSNRSLRLTKESGLFIELIVFRKSEFTNDFMPEIEFSDGQSLKIKFLPIEKAKLIGNNNDMGILTIGFRNGDSVNGMSLQTIEVHNFFNHLSTVFSRINTLRFDTHFANLYSLFELKMIRSTVFKEVYIGNNNEIIPQKSIDFLIDNLKTEMFSVRCSLPTNYSPAKSVNFTELAFSASWLKLEHFQLFNGSRMAFLDVKFSVEDINNVIKMWIDGEMESQMNVLILVMNKENKIENPGDVLEDIGHRGDIKHGARIWDREGRCAFIKFDGSWFQLVVLEKKGRVQL